MIGEDSVKIFYERADFILNHKNKVLAENKKIFRDIMKLEMRHNKLLAKSRELEAQYKVLVEAIELIKPLFKKKEHRK